MASGAPPSPPAAPSDDRPELIRPIPRRPFDLNRISPTPPSDDSDPPAPELSSGPQWLNAGFPSSSDIASSLSRPASSFVNLTSSTLFGIYSPSASSRNPVFGDREDNDTPWGTGAQTPIKRPDLDDATYELMRDRAHPPRRRSSYKVERPVSRDSSSNLSVGLSLGLRASLLFLLGVGYGAVVTQFHSEQQWREQQYLGSFLAEGIIRPGYNQKYLALWGVAGVFLGALMPWFDKIWEDTFGVDVESDEDEVVAVMAGPDGTPAKDSEPGTDWTLVMRAIGAFVGIIFAIRKLSWTSTLQISASLALVNPLLWWLIDRSVPGFLLSMAVGLAGSAFLLGVDPEMMPAPSVSLFRNTSSRTAHGAGELTFGGLASQQTLETGVWMVTLLFCSCVCFGNIGRRMAWSRSGRGRWGGLR